ncbi:MAG: hypothetical protein ACE5NG_17660, partial [bacterium]
APSAAMCEHLTETSVKLTSFHTNFLIFLMTDFFRQISVGQDCTKLKRFFRFANTIPVIHVII